MKIDAPEVTFEHGKVRKVNMNGWTPSKKNGRDAYSCAAVYVATIKKSNGWTLSGNWTWDVVNTNFNLSDFEEHNENIGDHLELIKVGGWIYQDEVMGFNMTFTAKAEFEKDGILKIFGFERYILGIADIKTGIAIETATMLLTDDDDEEDDEEEEEDDDDGGDDEDLLDKIETLEVMVEVLQEDNRELIEENVKLKKESVDMPLEWYAKYWEISSGLIKNYGDKSFGWFKRYVVNSINVALMALPLIIILFGWIL